MEKVLHVEMWNEWVSRASLRQWLGLSENQLIPVSEEEDGDGVTDKDDEDDNARCSRILIAYSRRTLLGYTVSGPPLSLVGWVSS